MLSSERSSNLLEELRVLDDSPHGVSMVSLCPPNIDLAAVKVLFLRLVLTTVAYMFHICFSLHM